MGSDAASVISEHLRPAAAWVLIIGGAITGNYINATTNPISIDGCTGVVISGNAITGAGTIAVGANSDHCRQSGNSFGAGVTVPAPTVPTLPASTAAATNTNPYAVVVYVSGGTVSTIIVNGSATGLLAGSFILNPGDTIQLNYTAAPGFSVRAVNP
jgi:hypothetical protein